MASVSSSVGDEEGEVMFGDWEKLNGALMRKFVRRVIGWLKGEGDEAFARFVVKLREEEKENEERGEEPNAALVTALEDEYVRVMIGMH